jgi:hypothetical protein
MYFWFCGFLFGCATTPSLSTPPHASKTENSVTPDPRPTSLPHPVENHDPPPPEPTQSVQTVVLRDFQRILEVPVRSIAVGKPPHVAVLADQTYWYDGNDWHSQPFPSPHALSDRDRVEIFFGRDNRPRLMGSATTGDTTHAVYYRWKTAGWRKEPSEIGKLAGAPSGGLFGVLGDEDPEVVCKVSDICLIKRRTGWSTFASGQGMPRVMLFHGFVAALHPDHLSILEENGWRDLPGKAPFSNATGFWGQRNALWVSEAQENSLFFWNGEKWAPGASPIDGPKALWGTAPNDVWLVGQGGAGHFDGSTWHRVAGLDGPLEVVTGSAQGDVWIGGPSGLWRGKNQESVASAHVDAARRSPPEIR